MMSTVPATHIHLHCIDWPTLARQPAGAGIDDAVPDPEQIATAARLHWQHLCQQQPAQPQVLLVCQPAGASVPGLACLYMVSKQAKGWLYHPQPHMLPSIQWDTHAIDLLQQAAQAAMQRGFCAADVAVLAVMGLFAAWQQQAAPQHVPAGFAHCGSAFPYLELAATGVWESQKNFPAFPAMPAATGDAEHAGHDGVYAVMGDSAWLLRCMGYGVRLLQLRAKQPDSLEALQQDIAQCAHAARQQQALLFVNDHWQAALRHARQHPSDQHQGYGLCGVHLGQEDLHTLTAGDWHALHHSGLRLGISTHSLWELATALHLRPSYIACGPIHATTTKNMPWRPLGEHNIRWWQQVVCSAQHPSGQRIPLVAIGGMDAARAQAAAAAGADWVAVVSHITQSAQPQQAIAGLRQAIARGMAQRQAPAGRPNAHTVDWPQPTLV